MKYFILISLFTALAITADAQNGEYIDRKEFYLIRTGADTKSSVKAHSISSLAMVNNLYGQYSRVVKEYSPWADAVINYMEYDDGLKFSFPEPGQNGNIYFDVTSDKYTLVLGNGKEIRVGMSAKEFEQIYPKSFSKRTPIIWMPIPGNCYEVRVQFVIKSENEIRLDEGSNLVFVFNMDGVLIKILTMEAI